MKQTAITESYQKPSHDEIALAAYLAWEKDGRPAGRDSHYWQQAEAELCRQRAAAAAKTKPIWPPKRIVTPAPTKLKKLTTSVRKVAAAGKTTVARKRKTKV